MKTFENKKREISFKNAYGETMTLVTDCNNEIWFRHTDCNEDFENLLELKSEMVVGEEIKIVFKYVLDKKEQEVFDIYIQNFFKLRAAEQEILHLDIDAPRNVIRKTLAKACGDNTRLKAFVYKVFRDNPDMEINAWEDYGWEWDVETNDFEDGKIATCNHDMRDDECCQNDDGSSNDGWEISMLDTNFAKFLGGFNWEKITLVNGKYLMLINHEDNLAFQIFDPKLMEDGKVELFGITWDYNGPISHEEFMEKTNS